jgi:hypothetical protein
MPKTADAGWVTSGFRRLLVWLVAIVAGPSETQRVLVECGDKIADAGGKAEQFGCVQPRYRDLQQQSDRGQELTQSAGRVLGASALPLRHVRRQIDDQAAARATVRLTRVASLP